MMLCVDDVVGVGIAASVTRGVSLAMMKNTLEQCASLHILDLSSTCCSTTSSVTCG